VIVDLPQNHHFANQSRSSAFTISENINKKSSVEIATTSLIPVISVYGFLLRHPQTSTDGIVIQ
jgi:hypothetical protein